MKCKIEDCARKAVCRGWCNPHYQKWYRLGDPLVGNTYENGRHGENNPNYKDGLAGHPLEHVWRQMIKRCTDLYHPRYKDYGGRGITVCERWLKSYRAFIVDMLTDDWDQGLWLDRVDNDGPYSKDNCKWATPSESNKNRRTSGYENRTRDYMGRFQ